jgi:porin
MTVLKSTAAPRPLPALPILLALLLHGSAAVAYDVNDWLSVGGLLAGAGQCQLLIEGAGASDACRGGLPLQTELSLQPGESDQVFVKLGVAAGNGLNEISPFQLRAWGADLHDEVTHANRRWSYLLNAWYKHRFTFSEDITLSVTGGVIDATDYLDGNAYSNDEYTQFMNEALVNGPNALLPSHDIGGALKLDVGGWSARGVVMRIGQNHDGNRFTFVGGQLGYRADTRWGVGNYRVLVTGASDDFLDPTGTREEGRFAIGLSFDQELGETLGAYLRFGWQDDRASIPYESIYSGGVQIGGGIWGRPHDNAGLAYAYLPGGNENLRFTHTAEFYYRFVPRKHLAITADLQYMRDEHRVGRGPAGFILGLRVVFEI